MSNNLFSIIKNYFITISIFIILISIFFIPAFSNVTITNTSQNELPNHQIITSTDIIWPLPGYTRISSYFGYRTAPTIGATSFHGGVDIPSPSGTNIISAISGKVTKTGFMGSGGCSVVIQNDCYTIIYHHVSPSYIVKVGDFVVQGQIVAHVGPKNVYGFSNNPYRDGNRESYKRGYNWASFAFYCEEKWEICESVRVVLIV